MCVCVPTKQLCCERECNYHPDVKVRWASVSNDRRGLHKVKVDSLARGALQAHGAQRPESPTSQPHSRHYLRPTRFGGNCEPLWPSGKAEGTSVRIRFGFPFSSKVLVCGHCLVTLSLTVNETLKWLSLFTILMQESFWLWQWSDSK